MTYILFSLLIDTIIKRESFLYITIFLDHFKPFGFKDIMTVTDLIAKVIIALGQLYLLTTKSLTSPLLVLLSVCVICQHVFLMPRSLHLCYKEKTMYLPLLLHESSRVIKNSLHHIHCLSCTFKDMEKRIEEYLRYFTMCNALVCMFKDEGGVEYSWLPAVCNYLEKESLY